MLTNAFGAEVVRRIEALAQQVAELRDELAKAQARIEQLEARPVSRPVGRPRKAHVE
jgi:BMFP domain-containing protein YqiC